MKTADLLVFVDSIADDPSRQNVLLDHTGDPASQAEPITSYA